MDNPGNETIVPQPIELNPQELAQAKERLILTSRVRGGVSWFFWIAGLSVINTLIYFFGGTTNFVVGLGATQFVDGIANMLANDLSASGGTIVRLIGLGVSIGISLLFATAGLLGMKRYRWAVIAGMVVYALDSIIFLLAQYWLGLAFHVFALWGLWTGLRAINALKRMEASTPVSIPIGAPAISESISWLRTDLVRTLGRMAIVYLAILVILAMIGFAMTR